MTPLILNAFILGMVKLVGVLFGSLGLIYLFIRKIIAASFDPFIDARTL